MIYNGPITTQTVQAVYNSVGHGRYDRLDDYAWFLGADEAERHLDQTSKEVEAWVVDEFVRRLAAWRESEYAEAEFEALVVALVWCMNWQQKLSHIDMTEWERNTLMAYLEPKYRVCYGHRNWVEIQWKLWMPW